MYLNMKCLPMDIRVLSFSLFFLFFLSFSFFFFFFLGGGGGGGGDEGKRGRDQNYSKRQHFEKLYLQTSLKNFAYIYAKTVLIYFYA